MREIILIVLITFFTSCTETNDDIAQKNVQEYILEHANDPDSYESVSFLSLDSVIVDEDYRMKNERYWNAQYNLSIDSSKENKSILEGITNRINVEAPAYTIIHTYRLKNGFGATMLQTTEFRLDKALDVKSYKDL